VEDGHIGDIQIRHYWSQTVWKIKGRNQDLKI